MKLDQFPFGKFQSIAMTMLVLFVSVLGVGCGGGSEAPAPETADTPPAAETPAEKAKRLAQEMLIVDTHVDVPYRLEEAMEDISQRTEKGDFDFVRAREGGLDAPFMSIYVPADYQESGGAKDFADSLIDMVEKFETDNPDKFTVASNVEEVLAAKAAGKVALPLGIENGAAVEDDLANLEHFFNRGVRYITLTHSKNNQICDSSYEEPDNRQWNGLSPFGKEVVAEMNRLGIMVDISHVSDDSFNQVMEITKAPAIASHSSCRHFTPGFERNMDDDMIQKLAENGGVVQINFGSGFLTPEAREHSTSFWANIQEHAKANGLERGSEELNAYVESYREQNPLPYATLDDVVAHIDHVVKLVGVDHVGIGSDFDGVGDSLPVGLKDVSAFPNLIEALLVKGYSDEDIEKILSGNIVRVWKAVEAKAAELQSQS